MAVTIWGGAVSAAQNKEISFLLCGGETPPPLLNVLISVQVIFERRLTSFQCRKCAPRYGKGLNREDEGKFE